MIEGDAKSPGVGAVIYNKIIEDATNDWFNSDGTAKPIIGPVQDDMTDTTYQGEAKPESGGGGGSIMDKIGGFFENGSFVVLGIVIIALAVLSNKQVQSVAMKAVTKGRA